MKGGQNLFKRFLSLLTARLLTTVIAILSTPIVARLLGPGGYGDYAVMLSILSLYMIPVSGSVTEGVQKYVAEYRAGTDWQENVVRFYAIVGVGIGLVAAVVLYAFTALGGAAWAFGPDFTLYFFLLAGLVLATQFRALTHHVVLGFGVEQISGTLNVVRKATTVGVGIALVLAVGLGVEGMLFGHVLANVLVGVVAGVVIVRRLSVRSLLGTIPDSFPYREVLSFNALNIVLVLMTLSLYHVDVIMLRSFVGSETTGFYKAALALAEYLWAVPKALQVVLLHSSSTLWTDGRHEEITRLASRVSRYTILLVVLLAIGLAALADELVPLYYGEAFAVATAPLLLLIPGVVGFAAARPLQAIGQGSGQITTLVAASGTAAAVNLGLNGLLIPRYGMMGAAVATSLSYGSMFALLVWASRRIGFDPLQDLRPVRIAATALVSAVPIVLLARWIQHDVVALLVVPPTGLVVYSAVALLTGALDRAEVLDILRKLPDPIGSAVESGVVWLQ